MTIIPADTLAFTHYNKFVDLKVRKLKIYDRGNSVWWQIKNAYILNGSVRTVFPTEVHQSIVRLVDVYHSLPLVRMDHFTLHKHFTGPEFDQIFTLGTPGTAKQCSWSHFFFEQWRRVKLESFRSLYIFLLTCTNNDSRRYFKNYFFESWVVTIGSCTTIYVFYFFFKSNEKFALVTYWYYSWL